MEVFHPVPLLEMVPADGDLAMEALMLRDFVLVKRCWLDREAVAKGVSIARR